MKKMYLVGITAIAMLGFTACKDSVNETAKHDAESLTFYVDSVEKATPVYTQANWTAIDEGYRERARRAEAALEKLEAEDKARAEEAMARFATFRTNYEIKVREADAPKTVVGSDYRAVLRNRLFGEGKIGADMKFGFVTGNNILSVYKNFVEAVDAAKDSYTREDWDEVKVLYEALDSRKNEVEKDLSTGDNLKIAALKLKFARIKSVNRPGAKIEENVESKQ